ncbi:MAG: RluA family pseudouridine synthase [Planctomycetes bacterium]|jgi:23S rRNA pseudouridine1911/1915/1917 synthase|nr:RluA family pseudouridine synthase [Planctomycetota bacterium]
MSNLNKENLFPQNLIPTIIHECADYLVINKPAGLIVHGAKGTHGITLVDWLLKRYPEIEKIGEDKERPGIVHRLDKEASGLMVIARNDKMFTNLKNQFQTREVGKEYTALVYGKIIKDDEEIHFPIRRSAEGFKMAALPITEKVEEDKLDKIRSPRERGSKRALLSAREAHTFFSIVKRYINYTLLKVRITTGRTHQIRVHLFAYGHPLVGDELYCNKKTKVKNKKLNLQRIFLIADRLSFFDLEGERQYFSIDLPSELERVLEIVK